MLYLALKKQQRSDASLQWCDSAATGPSASSKAGVTLLTCCSPPYCEHLCCKLCCVCKLQDILNETAHKHMAIGDRQPHDFANKHVLFSASLPNNGLILKPFLLSELTHHLTIGYASVSVCVCIPSCRLACTITQSGAYNSAEGCASTLRSSVALFYQAICAAAGTATPPHWLPLKHLPLARH